MKIKVGVATPYNNPGAADGIKILTVMQRRFAAADQERYTDKILAI
ncbi:MAG: hypothetical protein HC840_13750 [Leptolyngbyaceae cyanobacterium RM2_2_4]|nr:hypothetical protein [Leptolyngbyaceae cyanobacterium SM1_4_3]NJO50314.1 hypothetical protein [Leptolyngbyaceae cyanobacterium RM2_2_4]